MKAIIFYILMLSLSLIHNDYIGDDCDSKNIANTIDENGPASDYSIAHHGIASCASLYPYNSDTEDEANPKLCCYAKIKYKIEDDTFTRKGCIDVDVDANGNLDIDTEIQSLEKAFKETLANYISDSNIEIKIKDVDIDCNSKFLKYSALLILIILL